MIITKDTQNVYSFINNVTMEVCHTIVDSWATYQKYLLLTNFKNEEALNMVVFFDFLCLLSQNTAI